MNSKPIYISSIEINGLFGNRDIRWDNLHQDVNILGGPNGSGKSIILKSCYELLSIGKVIDLKCIRLIESILIEFTNGWRIHWKRVEVDDFDELKVSPVGLYAQAQFEDNRNNTNYLTTTQVFDGLSDYTFARLSQLLKVSYINSFEQQIAEAVEISKRPDETRTKDSTLLDAYIKEEWNRRNEIYNEAYATIMDLLQKEGKVTIKRNSDIDDYFKLMRSCEVFFDYSAPFNGQLVFLNKKREKILYTQLSTGEKQLLLLLLKVTNTQNKPAIFFMDEPDLGMHVDWKKKLLFEINKINPNLQLFVATHAPSMVTGWRECVKEIGQLTSLRGED